MTRKIKVQGVSDIFLEDASVLVEVPLLVSYTNTQLVFSDILTATVNVALGDKLLVIVNGYVWLQPDFNPYRAVFRLAVDGASRRDQFMQTYCTDVATPLYSYEGPLTMTRVLALDPGSHTIVVKAECDPSSGISIPAAAGDNVAFAMQILKVGS